MSKVQEQVREFHRFYSVPTLEKPAVPKLDRLALRKELIDEEFFELKVAFSSRDIVEIADALGDLLYVIYGTAIECGIDMDPVMDEIHESNLSKLGDNGKPIYNEQGKVMKGPNYRPPNIKARLDEQA